MKFLKTLEVKNGKLTHPDNPPSTYFTNPAGFFASDILRQSYNVTKKAANKKLRKYHKTCRADLKSFFF